MIPAGIAFIALGVWRDRPLFAWFGVVIVAVMYVHAEAVEGRRQRLARERQLVRMRRDLEARRWAEVDQEHGLRAVAEFKKAVGE